MNRLQEIENAKKIIKLFYESGIINGLYKDKTFINDRIINLYKSKNIKLDMSLRYKYFKIFGLNDDEFNDILKYYKLL